MNFDPTLICHKLLVNFSLQGLSLRQNELEISWTRLNGTYTYETHDNCNSYESLFRVSPANYVNYRS